MKYVITGAPVVLKNSKRLIHAKGRIIPIPSKKALGAEQNALQELLAQKTSPTIREPINAKMTFYGAWKFGGGNVPDLSNLYQAYEDWMEKARVIENDRLIEGHDGSRRVYMCDTCDMRPIIKSGPRKGQHKPDCGKVKQCPFQRTEIKIEKF